VIPYTVERRDDTGVTNVVMGIWLFLASEVMLFGSLFSAYALLRIAAPVWPEGSDLLSGRLAGMNTLLLTGVTTAAWRARSARPAGRWLLLSTLLAVAFLVVKGFEYRHEFATGLLPSASTFLAMYFTLTGLHALHVAGGAAANLWTMAGGRRAGEPLTIGRAGALSLYWAFVDLVWLVILVLFYLT
jgi:cytochrome c oxidase subunit III